MSNFGKHFSFRRLGHLAKISLYTNGRNLGLGTIIGAGAYIFLYFMATLLKTAWEASVIATTTFVILGIFLNTSSFRPFHRTGMAELMLTLPVSRLERFVFFSLQGSIIYILVFFTGSFIVDRFAALITTICFGRSFDPIQIFSPEMGKSIIDFLTIQPILLFGSIYFKRLATLKTAGSLLAFGAFLMVVLIISFVVLFNGMFNLNDLQIMNSQIANNDSSFKFNFLKDIPGIETVLNVFSKGITPIFFLFLTWLRIGETEIHRGVR